VLDHGLREDFGFAHILWVYSGRRGIHCWVCDERARRLPNETRGAIAAYLAIYKGQEKGAPKLALAPPAFNHPAVEAAYDTLLAHWNQVRECHCSH
jgi:DNA primase small subunit